MRCRPVLLPLLLLLALPPSLAAVGFEGPDLANDLLSDDETDQKYHDRRRQLAADYRLDRERIAPTLPEAHHVEAHRSADAIAGMLSVGEVVRARRAAIAALRSHGYSRAAGRFQHALLRTWLAVGDLRRTRLALIDLEERYPDHPEIGLAHEEVLLVARKLFASGELINLDAPSPAEVINVAVVDRYVSANKLFRHLVIYGDRHRIAPEAGLYLARSMLATSYRHRDKILVARDAYRLLLDRFPNSPYVFEALCELAISHLVTYRGDQFDRGALIAARSLLHRARPYIDNDPAREETLRRYNLLIRAWQQERDLAVARWYRSHGHPDDARYYYTETIAHDPSSAVGITAASEQADLPLPEQAPSGATGTR